MGRKGLSNEIVLTVAADLIAERGVDQFSMRELAERLDVKTASLYNHITSIRELFSQVGHLAIDRLNGELSRESGGKEGKSALLALAVAYRRFAKENPELYKMILKIPAIDDKELVDTGHVLVSGLYPHLRPFLGTPEAQVHFARAFRSAMHGFLSLEDAGFFKSEISAEQSYLFMIRCLISSLDEKKREGDL